MPSAPSVAGPATPSTTSPREAWKRRTAARVIGPYTPSAEMPSARCSAAVVEEGALVTVRGPAATPIPSARDVIGPTTPSTSSPWAAWKRRTAARVTGPNSPSAAIPSARWTAATPSPSLPRWSIVCPSATPTGTTTIPVSSAADTCAPVTRVRLRTAACARRRCERSSERCHNSTLARSRSDIDP